MGEAGAFLKIGRQTAEHRPACERIEDYAHVCLPRPDRQSREQASRCMDCGTPFCHWACPLGNHIPEWNDLMFKGRWKMAFELLDAANNLPEITGRLCPAVCEYACVLGIDDEPVTIRENELAIIEYAYKKGFIKPRPPRKRTGKKAAVVGSGPAGLSCAAQLNRAGHDVTVFERDDKAGGILRYGIPDFKLEKHMLERRIKIFKEEGIVFKTGVDVGTDYPISKLKETFDAVCVAGGSRVPRDLRIEGRGLKGICLAMDYLVQSNKRVAGEKIFPDELMDAKGKKVVIIGGGDTGADCVGTARRQGASCIVQIELLPQPPECRLAHQPWPQYPMLLKTSSSHQEGGRQYWSVLTKKFIGRKGVVEKISCVKVKSSQGGGKSCPEMKKIPGTEFEVGADLVILAIGFAHPEHKGLIRGLKAELDNRGNVSTDDNYMTSIKGVFCAGDMRRGQSLIVWAISEGRRAAYYMDAYLTGRSSLPVL